MRLSQQAIDLILAVVAQFDRERGIPHDYYDLEDRLKKLRCDEQPDGTLTIEIPGKEEHPPKVVTLDPKSAILAAEKEW